MNGYELMPQAVTQVWTVMNDFQVGTDGYWMDMHGYERLCDGYDPL